MTSRKPELRKRCTGDISRALRVARKAAEEVPAYRRLVKAAGLLEALRNEACTIEDLPVIDKESYCLSNKYSDLLAASLQKDINGFFSSSGSSGKPFHWPRLKGARSSLSLPDWLEDSYRLGGKKTLAVVALNMDGWIAGLNTSLALNQLALEARFPFMVSCPGADYGQALNTIAEVQEMAEQIVVFIYPVAIPYFLELAKDRGIQLPLDKMRFAATGDPFTESFRENLDKICGAVWPDTALASYCYSSADTRVIGTETRLSRALSKLLHHDAALRGAFGVEGALPNLYLAAPAEELPLIETVEGELVFTRWQPIPIVRYNLHDRGEIWDWTEVRRQIIAAELPEKLKPMREELARQETFPGDFVALYGRSRSLYFYGMYLDERVFSKIMRHPELETSATGIFQVALSSEKPYSAILWDIEIKQAHADPAALDKLFYRVLLKELMEAYPHFGVNYRNFLQKWDSDPAKRIFRFNFHVYPKLSQKVHDSKKHRIIRQ
jgi:phenylacetate-CoA ligase